MPCRFGIGGFTSGPTGTLPNPLKAPSKRTLVELPPGAKPCRGGALAAGGAGAATRRGQGGRLGWAAFACGLFLLGGATAFSNSANVRGLPFSRVYSLEEIGYVPRGSQLNFDPFGRVAVINEGVYAVLNDTAWSNLADATDATHPPMTEVVHAGYGRSYYAGRASWGLAEFGTDGKLHAKSLVPANPAAWTRTTTFDEVIVTSEGVYFGSRAGVAFWDFTSKECQLFEAPKMARAFAVGNRVFVSSFDRALRYIDVKARAIRAVPGSRLDQRAVVHTTMLDDKHALVSFFDGPPLVFDGETATPWRTEDTVNLTGRIAALARLTDGNIAIAVTGKGVFVLSPEGRLLLSLTIPQYHRVSSIASRERGVLWLLTEDSIEKVLYQGGLSSFGQRLGLPLQWPTVASWHDRFFVCSGVTLYEAMATAPGATARFEPLKNQPPGGAWLLTAAGPHLLVGSRSEVFTPEPDGNWKSIAHVGDLRQLVMVGDNVCYAIGQTEIALLEWNGERWLEPVARIAGLRNPAYAYRAGQSVWVEMAGDGVARISRKDGRLNTMVLPNEPWTKALWVNIGVVNDTVVLSPARENRRFFDERTEQWCERPDLQRLFDRSPRWLNRVWSDEMGTIWGTHSEGLVRFTPKGGDYEMDLASFDLINDRYPNVRVLPGNDVWISASRSLHHVEPVANPAASGPDEPVLVSINDTRQNVELLANRSPRSAPLSLPFGQNSLTFQFFSGGYAWRRAPIYEFRLSSSDPWATIDTGSSLRFPSLHEGQYHLQVRIAGVHMAPGAPLNFDFEILPPWPRTWPAYVVYSSLGLLLIVGLTRWSNHLARRRNLILEQVVQERTTELESTMKRLNEETRITATLAERDRLAGEIHDSVQQGLSGAILQLDTTLRLPVASGDLRARLNVVRNMISYARQEVQHAVWDMHSPLLEGNDLGEALGKLATFTALNDLVPTVTINGSPARQLPRATTHHLLRVAQEATTNAVRHAGAHQIAIVLTFEDDAVVLTVSDDGSGFCSDDVLNKPGHFGLRGIRSRVKKLQGELEIESLPGVGTSISVRVPLTPQKHGLRRSEDRLLA